MTVSRASKQQLQEYLWARGVVEHRWMFQYMKKEHLVKIYLKVRDLPEGKTVQLPEAYVERITKLREAHLAKTRATRRDRKALYGTSVLTSREVLSHIHRENPQLSFVEHRGFSEPFQTATGTSRGKSAAVFVNPAGEEFLFSISEVKALKDLGVEVPDLALRPSRVKTKKVGLGGLIS